MGRGLGRFGRELPDALEAVAEDRREVVPRELGAQTFNLLEHVRLERLRQRRRRRLVHDTGPAAALAVTPADELGAARVVGPRAAVAGHEARVVVARFATCAQINQGVASMAWRREIEFLHCPPQITHSVVWLCQQAGQCQAADSVRLSTTPATAAAAGTCVEINQCSGCIDISHRQARGLALSSSS